ncbi:MAG: hypothetical protein JXA93_08200 [Anaerolineae bacterium]|nr:hypothetical protein [Anaerolineae bacterium]
MDRDRVASHLGADSIRGAERPALCHTPRYLSLVLLVIAVEGIALTLVGTASAASQQQAPEWLEPRGLSVVDLVGQVPEELLEGTILSYGDWAGIVVYDAGVRISDTLVVTTTIYSRVNQVAWSTPPSLTLFGCLGQTPHYDHMGSIVPSSTLRVYADGGREVTSEILLLSITELDRLQPAANSGAPFRYPEVEYSPWSSPSLPLEADGLHLPANAGCWIRIAGADYYPLTGVFTVTATPPVSVTVLGVQTATFQSYIGEGWLGIFQPLMDQLLMTYPERHDRIPLDIPSGANFFLAKFPPTPVDPYTDTSSSPGLLNMDRPSAGTYRLSDGTPALSTDLVFSGVFPLGRAWLDSDKAPRAIFLPVIAQPSQLAPLEYVVPAGVPYYPCFTTGDCPGEVLQEIYDAQMVIEIIYLQVERGDIAGEWVRLQMAGPAWAPFYPTYSVLLPLVIKPGDGESILNSWGWFDTVGRMLDMSAR